MSHIESLSDRLPSKKGLIRGGVLAGMTVVALGLAGCGEDEAEACVSERTVSAVYAGDVTADSFDQSTWLTGVEVSSVLHSDAEGLVVSYRHPNGPNWNDSQPIAPEAAARIALKIGAGDVIFSTQTLGTDDSSACDQAPASAFSAPQDFNQLRESGAVLPYWP